MLRAMEQTAAIQSLAQLLQPAAAGVAGYQALATQAVLAVAAPVMVHQQAVLVRLIKALLVEQAQVIKTAAGVAALHKLEKEL